MSLLWSFSLFVVHSVFDTLACVRFCVCVIGLCLSRRPSVTLCTDRRTHGSRRGLWEGGVALRGRARLLSFPFFPPSRPSSPPVLRPSPPLTYRLQVFFFFILRHLLLSVSVPYNLSPPVPLALLSFLHYSLPSVNVSVVVGCHAALRSPPFWFIGHNRRNFSRAHRDSTPCWPSSFSCFHYLFFSLSLCPSSSPLSALGQQALTGWWTVFLWLSVLNRCLVVDWQEEDRPSRFLPHPRGLNEAESCSGQYKFSSWPVLKSCTHRTSETLVRFLIIQSCYDS